ISIDKRNNGGYYLKFGTMDKDRTDNLISDTYSKYGKENTRINQISEQFSKTLQKQSLIAIILAFIGMALVVLIAFRMWIPAMTVVFAGLADITITASVMNIIGIELTLATTAALLMLIGYSVDSNILLTNKVLKYKGSSLSEKMSGAFHTGFIMTTSTLAAIIAMYLVSWSGNIQTIADISLVLIIGLVCDMIFTWIFNAGVLRYLLEKENSGNQPINPKNKNKVKGAQI
ncbi:MAG TPA: protein translocase subunit SecF, partial [Methanocorpusculum sp.]|nr:protein translocase subunit SecF [Methanocorpusculum sp.]